MSLAASMPPRTSQRITTHDSSSSSKFLFSNILQRGSYWKLNASILIKPNAPTSTPTGSPLTVTVFASGPCFICVDLRHSDCLILDAGIIAALPVFDHSYLAAKPRHLFPRMLLGCLRRSRALNRFYSSAANYDGGFCFSRHFCVQLTRGQFVSSAEDTQDAKLQQARLGLGHGRYF